jgi:hypothetical protein
LRRISWEADTADIACGCAFTIAGTDRSMPIGGADIVHPGRSALSARRQGGVAQGAGQALLEEVVYDRDSGQCLTGTLLDCGILRADMVPEINIDFSPVLSTTNPLGAKGAGEGVTVASAPAVMNAILDALAPHPQAGTRLEEEARQTGVRAGAAASASKRRSRAKATASGLAATSGRRARAGGAASSSPINAATRLPQRGSGDQRSLSPRA